MMMSPRRQRMRMMKKRKKKRMWMPWMRTMVIRVG
jgi:hypothetical protein